MIAVIDYGLGNIKSVFNAFKLFAGEEVKTVNSAYHLKDARALILPGVGAFARGMENLDKLGILGVILREIEKGKPFLGICLGMQLLFTRSEEHSVTEGMGILPGEVIKFPGGVKIPHMGWNRIVLTGQGRSSGLWAQIPEPSYFYFVHSYYVKPEENVSGAMTCYGMEFTSAVVRENITGVQFHPERSGDMGLKFIDNFVKKI